MSLKLNKNNKRRRRNKKKNNNNNNNKSVKRIENKVEKKVEQRIERKVKSIERESINKMASPSLMSFAEAVTHPFGNGAMGATLPDRYQELILPSLDRLEIDVGVTFWDYIGATTSWIDDETVQLDGCIFWFEPRCFAAGTCLVSNLAADTWVTYQKVGIDGTTFEIDSFKLANQYTLCCTGMWTVLGEKKFGFYKDDTDTVAPVSYAISYTKFSSIIDNIAKMRILGAGIKLWPESPIIETGGINVGGWMPLSDIYKSLEISSDGTGPANGARFSTSSTSIKFPCHNIGVQGVTVRYSCLQCPEQIDMEYPQIPTIDYTLTGTTLLDAKTFDPKPPYNLAVNDVVTPGTMVPYVFWSFNPDNSGTTRGAYGLKLISVVHSEGVPVGSCPFIARPISMDPLVSLFRSILQNPAEFPAAVSGHSFKSFISKARRVTNRIASGADKAAKFLSAFHGAMGLL